MKLVNIGFGNLITVSRLIAIMSPDSAPAKRSIQEARDNGLLLDGTFGRKTRAILVMDEGHVVLSAVQPETIAARIENNDTGDPEVQE